jgi:hypothetical protein
MMALPRHEHGNYPRKSWLHFLNYATSLYLHAFTLVVTDKLHGSYMVLRDLKDIATRDNAPTKTADTEHQLKALRLRRRLGLEKRWWYAILSLQKGLSLGDRTDRLAFLASFVDNGPPVTNIATNQYCVKYEGTVLLRYYSNNTAELTILRSADEGDDFGNAVRVSHVYYVGLRGGAASR